MFRLLLISLLAVASFACFMPTMHDWINRNFGIKKFYIPWLGLAFIAVWTLFVVPAPYRGALLGLILIKFGILLLLLPKKLAWRKLLENMFFGGQEVLVKPSVTGNATSLIAVGAVIFFPILGRGLDTLTVFAVIGYFVWHAWKIERGGRVAEGKGSSTVVDA